MTLIDKAFYIAWDNQHKEVAMVQWCAEQGGWLIMYYDFAVHPEVFSPLQLALDPSDFENCKDSEAALQVALRLARGTAHEPS